jgi:hypothetical protein
MSTEQTPATKFAEIQDAATGEPIAELHAAARSDDALSLILCVLTRELQRHTGEQSGGGLGGPFGYGLAFENDVFMMHPYCWCERPDCAWCRTCVCETDEQCRTSCQTNQPGAPNFHFKPADLKVRWYKYIGRGMELDGESDLTAADILRACLTSFGGPGVEAAIAAYYVAEEEYSAAFERTMNAMLGEAQSGEARRAVGKIEPGKDGGSNV